MKTIQTIVSGNEEFYIGDLNTYTIIDSGSLAAYFDKSDGAYSSKIEEGYIKNHLKDGKWIEKKANFGYVNNETYGVGNYKNGVQIGMWNYFMLKTIEKANDQGYITNTYTKKIEQLLMTEEYTDNGKLLKRELFYEN